MNIKVFVTFDPFKASFLNTNINLFEKVTRTVQDICNILFNASLPYKLQRRSPLIDAGYTTFQFNLIFHGWPKAAC